MAEIGSIDSVLVQMRAMAARAQGLGAAAPALETAPAAGSQFASLLSSAVQKVNETQAQSRQMATAFESGAPGVDLADVMISMQKASLSFQATTQVRNRLVSAYQEIMNMPI